jgi:hypothetical protein
MTYSNPLHKQMQELSHKKLEQQRFKETLKKEVERLDLAGLFEQFNDPTKNAGMFGGSCCSKKQHKA